MCVAGTCVYMQVYKIIYFPVDFPNILSVIYSSSLPVDLPCVLSTSLVKCPHFCFSTSQHTWPASPSSYTSDSLPLSCLLSWLRWLLQAMHRNLSLASIPKRKHKALIYRFLKNFLADLYSD